jgi:hypothetical protein
LLFLEENVSRQRGPQPLAEEAAKDDPEALAKEAAKDHLQGQEVRQETRGKRLGHWPSWRGDRGSVTTTTKVT